MNKNYRKYFTIFIFFLLSSVFLFSNLKQANADLGICSSYDFFAKFVDSSGKTIVGNPVVYDYGDDIYVYVYFKNTGECSSTLTFNGTKYVDSYFTPKVLVRNMAGETSSYWYGNTTDIPFQVNITGSSAYEINPLWYRVNPLPPTLDFSVDKTTINRGESIVFSYTVKRATSCTASRTPAGAGTWIGDKDHTNGTHTVSPATTPTSAGTKTYKLSCANPYGTVEKTVDVVVNPFLVDGVCGTRNNKVYASNYVSWPVADTSCAAGTSNPVSPVFPAAGATTFWTCVGLDGGVTASCSASKVNPNTLVSNPNPIQVCDGSGIGTTTLTWNAPGIATVSIRVGSAVGDLVVAGPATGSKTYNSVTNGMKFFLIKNSDGSTLATNTTNLTTDGCSVTPPPPPASLSASCNASGQVSTSWSAVSGSGITYALRIDTDTNPPHLLAVDNLTGTSYTWNGGVMGTAYNVWVHAVQGGLWSDPPTLTTVSCGVPFVCTGATPANSTLCAGDDTGLTADTPKKSVLACTVSTKCEYVPTASTEEDCGLRVFDGVSVQRIACEPVGSATSPLRIYKNGAVRGVALVDLADTAATKTRIKTASGTKALKKL